jgi:hypothetical protein
VSPHGGNIVRIRTLHLVAILVLAASLAACAKRSEPAPPKDEVNTYPRSYPSE